MIEKPLVSYPPSIHRAHAVITALSDAFDELKALYDYERISLREVDMGDVKLFKLSPQEAVGLASLLKQDVVSVQRLMKAMMRRESESERPENLIRVVLYKLRKKLGVYGGDIVCYFGSGYSVQNIELARENARNGIKIDYAPDPKYRGVPSEERWAEVLQVLRDSGPLIAREIVEKLTVHWPVTQGTKYLQLRLWLRQKETEGVVSSSYIVYKKSRVYMWQLCNTVA